MPRKSVKLVSAEGFEFTVDYRAACVSNTIKQMLSSEGMHPQSRSQTETLRLCQVGAVSGGFTRVSPNVQEISRKRSWGKSTSRRSRLPSWRRSASTFTID